MLGSEDPLPRDPHLGKSRRPGPITYEEEGENRKRCKQRVLLPPSLGSSTGFWMACGFSADSEDHGARYRTQAKSLKNAGLTFTSSS